MAKKVLSIEIGHDMTHVVEMSYQAKQKRIYQFFSFETPHGMVEDGRVRIDERFAILFREQMEQLRIHTREAIFVISSNRVATRNVTIPMVKENRISTLLEANSSEYFPVDLSQYQLAYQIIDKIDTEEEKKYQLSVFAIPKEIIDSYQQLSQFLKLELIALDNDGNAIVQGMKAELSERQIAVSLKLDERSTIITVTENGSVTLQRTVSYGLEEAIAVVQASFGHLKEVGVREALNLLGKYPFVQPAFSSQEQQMSDSLLDASTEDLEEAVICRKVTDSLQTLTGNLARVIDYYTSKGESVQIERIILSGSGAGVSGLDELLKNELGIAVTNLKTFLTPGLLPKQLDPQIVVAEYVSVIGATLSPLHLNLPTKMEKHKGPAGSESAISLKLPIIVCSICVAAGVLLSASAIFSSLMLSVHGSDLQKQITKLAGAQKTYDTYAATKTKYDDAVALGNQTKTSADAVLTFFQNMQDKLPSDVVIDSMSATADGISLSMKTATKESAAMVITQLRTMEEVQKVAVEQLTEETDESGNKSVTFTVTMSFTAANEAQAAAGETAGKQTTESTENQTTETKTTEK